MNSSRILEDIGHLKEARVELKKHLLGNFKIDAATLAKMKADAEANASKGGSNMMVILLVALIAAYVAYTQMSWIVMFMTCEK